MVTTRVVATMVVTDHIIHHTIQVEAYIKVSITQAIYQEPIK